MQLVPCFLCPACNLFLSVSCLSCRLGFLLSLDNLLDLNLQLMFSFCGILRFNRSGLFSDLLLFAVPSVVSVSRPSTHRPFLCCCSSSDFLTVCIWFSQLGCFQLLNFNLGSNLNLVVSCFLGNFQFLFCFHASTTFSIHVSRHRSNFFLRDIVLLIRLGLQLALLFLFF